MNSTDKRNGGPAFPVHPGVRDDEPHAGMSLRDWFAGQALAGLLAANATYAGKTNDYAAIAADAFAHADVMIAERSK